MLELINTDRAGTSIVESDEISLKELIQKIRSLLAYVLERWLSVCLVGILGAGIGYYYGWIQPIKYSAKEVFVVEEKTGGSSGLGSLASLAGQFGVDVGGSASSGLLSSDNILLYFKSPSLAREVLLSPVEEGSKKSFIDEYIDVYELKDSWKKIKNVNENELNFQPLVSGRSYTRLQDSLLQQVTNTILEKEFTVQRTDKKAGFIEVIASMKNEALSKKYCEGIVNVAVSRYIQVKTQRQKSSVDKLQFRADSIANLLSRKTQIGASLQTSTATMDINPLYRTGTAVAAETTTRDKTMLATIFASVTQNLEIAKFTLSQETPVIQIIDAPVLPLKKDKVSKLKMLLLFGFGFGFVYIVFLIARKELKAVLS